MALILLDNHLFVSVMLIRNRSDTVGEVARSGKRPIQSRSGTPSIPEMRASTEPSVPRTMAASDFANGVRSVADQGGHGGWLASTRPGHS